MFSVDKNRQKSNYGTVKSTILRYCCGKGVQNKLFCPQNFKKILDIIYVYSYNKIYLL